MDEDVLKIEERIAAEHAEDCAWKAAPLSDNEFDVIASARRWIRDSKIEGRYPELSIPSDYAEVLLNTVGHLAVLAGLERHPNYFQIHADYLRYKADREHSNSC